MPQTVNVLVAEGCAAASCSGLMEALNIANRIYAQVQTSATELFTCKAINSEVGNIESSSGLSLQVASDLTAVNPGDIVYIPGFSVATAAEVDALLAQHAGLIDWLATQARQCLLVSSCSGAFLLAAGGLLDGKRATTAWWLHNEFAVRYPQITLDREAMVVSADNIITGAGSSAYYDVALRLIERYADRFMARTVAKYLMMENQRPSQTPYTILSVADSENQLVANAEAWIRAHLAEDFRLEQVAEHLGVSPRTLVRHFQAALGESPATFTQKLRIEKCKALLETTALGFRDIVARCGYSDESAFRRVFTRHCQMSPREYRKRFSRHQAVR